MTKTIYVNCPYCEGVLEVNAATGEVVEKWDSKDKIGEGQDKMTGALKKLEDAKKRRKDLFSTKQGELESQRKKLAKSFEDEVQKAKKKGLDEKPLRPFDLD